MTDTPWAAREGDALLHSSMLADVLGGVLEIAASVAVTALATAAVVAAAGLTVAAGFGFCGGGRVSDPRVPQAPSSSVLNRMAMASRCMANGGKRKRMLAQR